MLGLVQRTCPVLVLSHIHILARGYATSADQPASKRRPLEADPHAKYGLPPWPNESSNPSPKQLFKVDGLSLQSKDFDRRVKLTYQRYVKIYHPDVSKNSEIIDTKTNKPLTSEEKRHRFDQISNCYNVLKDPQRRYAYWRFENSTSNYTQLPRSSTRRTPQDEARTRPEEAFQRFREAAAHRKAFKFENDEAFWKAATWEDYYRMKHKREPPSAAEIEKSKYQILGVVVVLVILSTVLQYLVAVRRTNDYHAQQELMDMKSEGDMQRIRNKRDREDAATSLERFLILRRFNFLDKGDEEKHYKKREREEVFGEGEFSDGEGREAVDLYEGDTETL